MQALDQVLGTSGMDVSSLAARFGVSTDQAQSALGSLMPAVLGGFQKKVDANDLAPATGAVGDAARPDSDAVNNVLGHIFGNKDVSRQVVHAGTSRSRDGPSMTASRTPVSSSSTIWSFGAGFRPPCG